MRVITLLDDSQQNLCTRKLYLNCFLKRRKGDMFLEKQISAIS